MVGIAEEFKNRLDSSINAIMPIIVAELIELKRSYFTEKGKPEWKPLAESTIAKKSSNRPKNKLGWIVPQDNAKKFNVEFGFLRNSIKVYYQLHGDELTLIVEAQHREGDQAIEQLIDGYGRDFLRFDQNEIEFIKKRLGELLASRF
jgi:hypothetical protein